MNKKRIIIMGAAGRDFHNFNVFFRDNSAYEIVAFTAFQIPHIENKTYPPSLSGKLYPEGILIRPEKELPKLIDEFKVDSVVFSYSDISHEDLMHKASGVVAAGADFWLLGPTSTMLKSRKPVISVCASRTGSGKSQTSRRIAKILTKRGKKVVSIRHPMPYGDLEAQRVQRFSKISDLSEHRCTIEEMEEYEPYIEMGAVIFAGVDYKDILEQAENEADVIIWDGGNNDYPFYHSDLEIVVLDSHRVGHEMRYYPGEVNFRRAQVIVINKLDTANRDDVLSLRKSIADINSKAIVIDAASPIYLDGQVDIRGKRVLVIGDGPTLTHGEMQYGAGTIAAHKYGAKELVDPRPFLKGELIQTFKDYPSIGKVLPAMGYGEQQTRDLEATINAVDCDVVVIGTPIDLGRVVKIKKPAVRVRYELQEIGEPDLESVLKEKFLKN